MNYSQPFTKETCLNPANIQVQEGYLMERSHGHGCGGLGQQYHVFLPKAGYEPVETRRYSVLDGEARTVETTVDNMMESVRKEALAKVNPKPLWDENWTGTRTEYEMALQQYEQQVKTHTVVLEKETLIVQEWEKKEGVRVLYADWEIQGVNDYYSDKEKPNENSLLALAVHEEHGCRCMGSSRRVLDEYEEEELLKNPNSELDYSWVHLTAPAVTLVTVNGEWEFLIRGHKEKETVKELLADFAKEWEMKESEQAKKLTDMETEYDSLLSEEELNSLPYTAWQEHKGEPSRKRNLEWQIRSFKNSNDVLLDKVRTPLHMTLPGIWQINDLGWIVDGTTHGRIWLGEGKQAENY